MKQYQYILLLGSAGYLGRTLTTLLQQSCHVFPTYRTSAYFADSYHYDFWVDDISPLVEYHESDIVIIAASMAYKATNESSFQEQVS